MTKPDTPFPKHWLYYIVLKYAVIAADRSLHRISAVVNSAQAANTSGVTADPPKFSQPATRRIRSRAAPRNRRTACPLRPRGSGLGVTAFFSTI
jgi:hypothetical protein